jgi:hypothetical protein
LNGKDDLTIRHGLDYTALSRYPLPFRSIRIIRLASKCETILGLQQLTGKNLENNAVNIDATGFATDARNHDPPSRLWKARSDVTRGCGCFGMLARTSPGGQSMLTVFKAFGLLAFQVVVASITELD